MKKQTKKPEKPEEHEGFCTLCRFKIKSFNNLEKCPNCDTTSVPCSYSNQVDININWQELRLLCIWAERWGHEKVKAASLIYSIIQRIQEQHQNKLPLSLAEEIQNLPKELNIKVITNIPGVETNKDGEVT